jgi:hypothetical protein
MARLSCFGTAPALVPRLEISLDELPFRPCNITIVQAFNKLPLIKTVII